MEKKSNLLSAVLILICVFGLFLALSSSMRLKKAELEFNEKKALLVKENLDLKDRLGSLEERIAKYVQMEKEKIALEEQLNLLKKENEDIRNVYNELKLNDNALISEKDNLIKQLDALKKKNLDLAKKLTDLESGSTGLAKKGGAVELTPIVVKPKEQAGGKLGKVLSVDAKNNLLVINLGNKDGIEKGESCTIFKDEEKIASGEIINVRYEVAAVFIEDLEYNNEMKDIKEGFTVLAKKSYKE